MGETVEGLVMRRKKNTEETLAGRENKNPVLGSRV